MDCPVVLPRFGFDARPDFSEQYVLWEGQAPFIMAILGSILLAIGLISALGLYRPYAFLSIFLL